APPEARTIVITCAAAPAGRRAELAARADVIVAGDEDVDLKAAVSALAERGHQRPPAEGRPGREPDRGRHCAAKHGPPRPAAAADPGPRAGRRRFPALPLHQERPLIPNDPQCLPRPRSPAVSPMPTTGPATPGSGSSWIVTMVRRR